MEQGFNLVGAWDIHLFSLPPFVEHLLYAKHSAVNYIQMKRQVLPSRSSQSGMKERTQSRPFISVAIAL